ncbi:hypothetical protein D3C73_1184120 [compost metagenome]
MLIRPFCLYTVILLEAILFSRFPVGFLGPGLELRYLLLNPVNLLLLYSVMMSLVLPVLLAFVSITRIVTVMNNQAPLLQ